MDDEYAAVGELRVDGAIQIVPAGAFSIERGCRLVFFDVEQEGEVGRHASGAFGVARREHVEPVVLALARTLAAGMNEDAVSFFTETEAVALVLPEDAG